MNRVRKVLLSLLGEKKYLSLLASTFQRVYKTGILGHDYQDIYFLKEFIREGDYCVDIGAHLGYFTLELSRLVKNSGRIYAIEPMSKFYEALGGMIREKNISNVDLRQLAMGGDSDWVEMGIPQVGNMKKFAYARVMESNTYLQYVESEKVKNAKGDELFAALPKLDFIKCDVEGLELSVFAGLRETLERHRPVLLCELGNRNDRIQLLDMLRPLGYQTYYLDQKRLLPLDVLSDVQPISHNHYFIPASRMDRFQRIIFAN
ncbi:MAG TPA: FkbM family methyltransferase [Puia sp.]|nr:FkbM family methyltransferase [Puia sp.]